mgnify:CR=1 FL=1
MKRNYIYILNNIYMKNLIVISILSLALFSGCSKNQIDVTADASPAVAADKPVIAGFSVANPVGELKERTTIQFKNTSENAVSYKWDFGNGRVYTEKEPEYLNPSCGIYNVTLTATDAKGNTSVVNKQVEISCIFANMPHPPKF